MTAASSFPRFAPGQLVCRGGDVPEGMDRRPSGRVAEMHDDGTVTVDWASGLRTTVSASGLWTDDLHVKGTK